MSDLFTIGASATGAYRNALTVIGQNVANAETAGYARRSAVITEAPVTAAGRWVRYNGADGGAVARGSDRWLAQTVRAASSDAASASARRDWMGRIETALGTLDDSVGTAMSGVFTASIALSADPASPVMRHAMLARLDDVAAAFRDTSARLSSVATGIADQETQALREVNDSLAALHQVNLRLVVARAASAERAGLEDERDRLIDSVSAGIAVDVTLGPDGTATLHAQGHGDFALIDRAGAGRLTGSGATLSVASDRGTMPLAPQGGALAGLADAAETLFARGEQADALARQFADALNDWSSGGSDAAGTSGLPLFTASGAGDMALLIDDPALLAAAGPSGGNANLLTLASLRDDLAPEDGWNVIVAAQGAATASATMQAQAGALVEEAARTALDRLGAVDLDREAAELLRLQQAYGAAAHILKVARESVDTIMAIM